MKRLLVLVAIVGAAIALYATAAPAGQQAVTPKQFAALKKQVTTMQKDVNILKNAAGFMLTCGFDQGAVGVTQAPSYHSTVTGETTDFYVLTTKNQDCVTAINSPSLKRLKMRLGG